MSTDQQKPVIQAVISDNADASHVEASVTPLTLDQLTQEALNTVAGQGMRILLLTCALKEVIHCLETETGPVPIESHGLRALLELPEQTSWSDVLPSPWAEQGRSDIDFTVPPENPESWIAQLNIAKSVGNLVLVGELTVKLIEYRNKALAAIAEQEEQEKLVKINQETL